MELTYRGQSLRLKRLLVDTGSGDTIITNDLAESAGIIAEENDIIYRVSGLGGSEFVFFRTVDLIKIGQEEIRDFPLEIGVMNYGFNLYGIIGMDFSQQIKATINIDKLTIEFN
jgi:predicted aspartyl protease